jgi:hypothetical protein
MFSFERLIITQQIAIIIVFSIFLKYTCKLMNERMGIRGRDKMIY